MWGPRWRRSSPTGTGVGSRPRRGSTSRVCEIRIGGRAVLVAIPQTYMNESGQAVAPLVRRAGIDQGDATGTAHRLIVVHDELDLPSGRVKVKSGGGTAGNNGLKSIDSHLHTNDYLRVRVGIGKPPGRQPGADYVLKRPGAAERARSGGGRRGGGRRRRGHRHRRGPGGHDPVQCHRNERLGESPGSTDDIAISVRGLTKSYGKLAALRGIDFEVRRGEVLALLGPNGAGKTTAVEILEGYRRRDGGQVAVLGVDPQRRDRSLRAKVGIVLQECAVDPYLTVAEVVTQRAGLYPSPRPVGEVIDLVGLGAKAKARVKNLSGGQQRRLDLGLALVGNPELIFLDEPTTGFDPSARREAWDVVRGLCAEGRTVVLTTHYMDEAQELADTVIVIAAGRVVASGSPDTLGGRDRGETKVRFILPAGTSLGDLPLPVGLAPEIAASSSSSTSPSPPPCSTPSPSGLWGVGRCSPGWRSTGPRSKTSTSSSPGARTPGHRAVRDRGMGEQRRERSPHCRQPGPVRTEGVLAEPDGRGVHHHVPGGLLGGGGHLGRLFPRCRAPR